MTKDEALKMAIEFIEMHLTTNDRTFIERTATLQACKEALEQPAQEPVAWVKDNLICPENGYETTRTDEHPKDIGWTPLYISQQARLLQEPIAVCKDSIVNWVNGKAIDGWLYTHPAPAWQKLSDDEIYRIYGEVQDNCVKDFPPELYAAWFKNTKEKNT